MKNQMEIMEQIGEIADNLEDAYLKELVSWGQSDFSTEKLRLSLFLRNKNIWKALVRFLTGVEDVFNGYLEFTSNIKLSLRYKDVLQYQLYVNRQPFIVTREVFCSELNKQKQKSCLWEGEIGVSQEFLKTIDLDIYYFADYARPEIEWKKICMQSDYAVIVLQAIQLLSEEDRYCIGRIVDEIMGAGRYAFLLTQTELMESAEVEEVLDYLKYYQENLSGQVPILTWVNKGQDDSFPDFLVHSLCSDSLGIREKTRIANTIYCIGQLKQCLTDTKAMLVVNREKNELLKTNMIVKKDELDKKIRGIERNLDLFVGGYLKSAFFRKTDEFSCLLNQSMRKEILQAESPAMLPKMILPYLQKVWKEFLQNQNEWMKAAIVDEMMKTGKQIEQDLTEVLSGLDEEVVKIIARYSPDKFSFNAPLFYKRSKNDSLKYLDFGALALMLVSIPWAALVFGTSLSIRYFFKKERELMRKEALTESVIDCNEKIKKQILAQIEIDMDKIADILKEQIRSFYVGLLSKVMDALEKHRQLIEKGDELFLYIDLVENKLALWEK